MTYELSLFLNTAQKKKKKNQKPELGNVFTSLPAASSKHCKYPMRYVFLNPVQYSFSVRSVSLRGFCVKM